MREPKRIKRILLLIDKLWNEYPDQRLGQLLENYVFGCQRGGCCKFHVEDDDVEKHLKNMLKERCDE